MNPSSRLLAAVGWSLLLPLSAAPVELLLAPGGGFDLTYSLSTGPSTTGRDDLSGNLLAEVRVNAAEQVEFFKLTGGRVAHADETMTLAIPPIYQVKFITQGVASLPLTEEGGGGVNPGSGVAANTGHRLISNEGTATTQYLAFGAVLGQEVRNLALNPDNTALNGTTSLTATVLASTGWWKRLKIDLAHDRDVSRTFPANAPGIVPAGTTYTVREDGAFSASGEGLFPGNDFMDWAALVRGVAVAGFEDRDPRAGQPLLVMYAMRAGEGPWQVPVEFRPDLQQVVLHLTAEGLRAPVKWEFWSGESGATWVPLAGTPEGGGITPAGAAGPVTVPLPKGLRGFVRASVPLPAE